MTTTTLILVFLDSDGKDKKLVINNPKENLSLEVVDAVMEIIADNDVLRTSTGAKFSAPKKCYYRTVTETPLVSENAE